MAGSSSSEPSMRAWQFASTQGGVEKHLRLNDAMPVPKLPSRGPATIVKVISVALNPEDYKVPEMPLGGRIMSPLPAVPATDFVGQVMDTNAPDLEKGDVVFGKLKYVQQHGALADFLLLPTTAIVAKVPKEFLNGATNTKMLYGLAGVGVAGLTALRSLEGVGAGMSILLNGASGGVGSFAVQFAKRVLGCENVLATCSGRNAGLVKELGADEVIDYKSQDVIQAVKDWVQRTGKKLDFVIDNVGSNSELYWEASHYLKEDGKFVQIGVPETFGLKVAVDLLKRMLLPRALGGGARKFSMAAVGGKKADLENIASWITEGKVRVVIDECLDMKNAVEGFEKMRAHQTRGKVIVIVNENIHI